MGVHPSPGAAATHHQRRIAPNPCEHATAQSSYTTAIGDRATLGSANGSMRTNGMV